MKFSADVEAILNKHGNIAHGCQCATCRRFQEADGRPTRTAIIEEAVRLWAQVRGLAESDADVQAMSQLLARPVTVAESTTKAKQDEPAEELPLSLLGPAHLAGS